MASTATPSANIKPNCIINDTDEKPKAEKTVTYEIGLWQQLFPGAGLEVSLFYRDIYNLLSTRIFSTYNQIEYGLYSNKDYGNARGLEVTLDAGYGQLKGMVNYTLQYTRGNADNPTQTFDRAGNNMDQSIASYL